ncbi:hypothetical protein [Glutamicibacter nicotianae]
MSHWLDDAFNVGLRRVVGINVLRYPTVVSRKCHSCPTCQSDRRSDPIGLKPCPELAKQFANLNQGEVFVHNISSELSLRKILKSANAFGVRFIVNSLNASLMLRCQHLETMDSAVSLPTEVSAR